MFEILPASSARLDTPASHALMSAAIHGALIGAAMLLTGRGAATSPARPSIPELIYTVPPQHPLPATDPTPNRIGVPTPPAPILEPIPMPAMDPGGPVVLAIPPRRQTETGDPGGPGSGSVPTWPGPSAPGAALTAAEVDDPVAVLEPGRLRYPTVLERAGVPGNVVVEFVVDTAGRVERRTLRIVASSHPGFEAAAREAALATRFRTARAHGTPVRQLVRQRLSFVAHGSDQ
jgi:TonB family protein